MNKNLRWRVITVLVVFIVFFAVGIYPILAQQYNLPAPGWLKSKQLKLGLDLRGGIQLMLRVHKDDALRISTEGTSEQLRQALQTASVNVGTVTVTSPTSFRVEGVPQDRDAEFRNIAEEHAGTNYDRSPGAGGSYEFTMRPNIANNLREQTMEQSIDTIDRRVNGLGVSEPTIARQGSDQILVQLPGVTEVARAKEIIGKTAVLELTHNWDTKSYDLGSGYGHVAIEVADAYKACEEVKKRGGRVTREAGPMKHGTTVIAFVEDPDGYKIEFVQRKAAV